MDKMRFFFLFLMVGVLGLVSCNDDDDSGDDFPNGKGIEGRVHVQNEFQQPLYDERDGIQVYFEVGFQDFTVDADLIGKYVLRSAPVGTYTATYSKEGYGTVVASDLNYSETSPTLPIDNGFQQFPSVTITKKPVTSFSNLNLDLTSVEVTNSLGEVIDTLYTLAINANMVPPPPPTGQMKGYRLFIGTDEMVSPEMYIYQSHFTSTEEAIEIILYDDWFNANDIKSGDVLWAALYGDANFDFTQEIDGETRYPNISTDIGALGSAVLP